MERYGRAFIRCVLRGKVEVEHVARIMHSIYGCMGFRRDVNYSNIICDGSMNVHHLSFNDMKTIDHDEEKCFAQLGSIRPGPHEPDFQLRTIAEQFVVPDEMKWCQLTDLADFSLAKRPVLLTCLRFRGEVAKRALSGDLGLNYYWRGGVYGFDDEDEGIDSNQIWRFLLPFEDYEVYSQDALENVFAIRTDLMLSSECFGFDRFLHLAMHEMCFRLQAELDAVETTVVESKFDSSIGLANWVDIFGFKPGVPRLLWQARPETVFVKHPNAALEAELEAYQKLVCLLAANDGRLPHL